MPEMMAHQPVLPEVLEQDADQEITDDEEVKEPDCKAAKHFWLEEADSDEGEPETAPPEASVYHFERIRASRWPPTLMLNPSTGTLPVSTDLRTETAPTASILFEGSAARSHMGLGYMAPYGQTIETTYYPETGTQASVIV